MKRPKLAFALAAMLAIASVWVQSHATAPQQQVSGGGQVTIVQGANTAAVTAGGALKVDNSGVTQPVSGTLTVNPGNTPNSTAWLVTGTGGVFPISGSISNTAFALNAGNANVGIVRAVPSACTQSTPFSSSTAQVATGAGTSVTGTSTCVTFAYANNITNVPVTLRLADKQGTPVIWFGGNNDYSIPANSNIRIPIDGVTFVSGITAIASVANSINLQINGLQ